LLHNISEECRPHNVLFIQAWVWLCMVWFRVMRFGMFHFSTSYKNWRWPHIF